jgi:hypothetical protein
MNIITSATLVPWIPVTSSNLEAYHYDQASRSFYLRFKKGKAFYVYANVEPTLVEEFQKAESHGKYFIANIKEQHQFSKFDIEKKEGSDA